MLSQHPQMLITRIITIFFFSQPDAQLISLLLCNMQHCSQCEFHLSLPLGETNNNNPWRRMGISRLLLQTWRAWKLVHSVKPLFMLSSASQISIWLSKPVRGQSIKRKDTIVTSFRDFGVRLVFQPSKSTQSHPRNPVYFFSLLYAVFPLFLFLAPCWKRGSVQSIPLYHCVVLVEATFIHWGMELKKSQISSKEMIQALRMNCPPSFSSSFA